MQCNAGESYNIGFSTHTGSVTAASEWDDPAAWVRVNPSLEGSVERLLHDTGLPHFALDMNAPEVRSNRTYGRRNVT